MQPRPKNDPQASAATPDQAAGAYRNLPDVLRERAALTPDVLAYRFLVDGESEQITLTFGQLDTKVRALAAHLQSQGMEGGSAMLLYPQGLDYLVAFWACLYARVTAIPLYVPRLRERSLARIQTIAQDAGCTLALTTAEVAAGKRTRLTDMPEFAGVRILATDTVPDALAANWKPVDLAPESLAYLQYTSGSTSSPKGVMISHGNLLHNLAFMARGYHVNARSCFVSWAPLFHDMGLILGTLTPLYVGCTCVLMSPASFAQRPVRWLKAIARYGGTFTPGSNFAYDMCVDRVTEADRATLDLSGWHMAITGAEPVRAETLDRFTAMFAPCGFRMDAFYPSFGIAENTLGVTLGRDPASPNVKTLRVSRAALERHRVVEAAAGDPDARRLVGCGLIYRDPGVIIVDPETRTRCAPDVIGEIWISGGSIAQGYWRRPEESVKTFRALLADTGEGPFLRTGDYGFVRDGELYIAGRLKDLIIIRGRNLYPQDIEATAERSHPGLRRGACAAFSVDVENEERIVVVQEVERARQADPPEAMIAAIRRAVVEDHEVQPHEIVLIAFNAIHKTSSGKIQRRACREAYLARELDVYKG